MKLDEKMGNKMGNKMDKIIEFITEQGFDVKVISPVEIKIDHLSWDEMKNVAQSLAQSRLCTPDEVFTYQPVSGWLNGYDFAVGVELQPMSAHNKTYAEDFITRFPKCAVRTADGITYPIVCRAEIYKDIVCRRETPSDCAACWNEVMED